MSSILTKIGIRPTAKEAREEREAIKAYRQKEIQGLKDLKATISVVAKDKARKEDIEHANSLISSYISKIQTSSEEEIDLIIENDVPGLRSFVAAFEIRMTISELATRLVTTALDVSADAKKILLSFAEDINKWLAVADNYWIGEDGAKQYYSGVRRAIIVRLATGDKTRREVKTIGSALGFSADEITSALSTPEVARSKEYEGPSPLKVAITVFLATIAIGIAITGGMLAANDAIFRPIPFRLLNFLYGTVFCFITLPFYFVRWIRGTAPKYYSMLPLVPMAGEPSSFIGKIVAMFFSYKEDAYFSEAKAMWTAQRGSML
jgi:hypothetical protein